MGKKSILVSNVSKSYQMSTGPKKVLRKINLLIEKGQKIAILGKNGSGKSTLIRLIGGMEEPDTGIIQKSMAVSWPLGYSGGTQGSLSGLDNIAFLSRIYGVDKNLVTEYVDHFSELGIALKDPVKTYSAGMRGRFNFALSMAFDFDCYLVDEGLAAGDSRFADKCRDAIKSKKDCSMLMVSHSSSIIQDFCDTGFVLENGVLLSFSSLKDALNYYNM